MNYEDTLERFLSEKEAAEYLGVPLYRVRKYSSDPRYYEFWRPRYTADKGKLVRLYSERRVLRFKLIHAELISQHQSKRKPKNTYKPQDEEWPDIIDG